MNLSRTPNYAHAGEKHFLVGKCRGKLMFRKDRNESASYDQMTATVQNTKEKTLHERKKRRNLQRKRLLINQAM